MSQVGQVLEDYTNWLNDHLMGTGDSFKAKVCVADFLKDYDKGEWLPNTEGNPEAPDQATMLMDYLIDFQAWLRQEGFQVPAGKQVTEALARAYMDSIIAMRDAEHETVRAPMIPTPGNGGIV